MWWDLLWSDLSSGADRLVLIIDDMTGHKPSIFFKLCWKFFIPAFSAVIEINLDRLGGFLPQTLWSSVTGLLPSVPGWLQTPPAGPVRLPGLGAWPGLVHGAVPCHLGTTVDNGAGVSDSRALQTGRYSSVGLLLFYTWCIGEMGHNWKAF